MGEASRRNFDMWGPKEVVAMAMDADGCPQIQFLSKINHNHRGIKEKQMCFLGLAHADMDSEEEKQFHMWSQAGTVLNSRGKINSFLSKDLHGK